MSKNIQVLDRALSIVEILAMEPKGLRIVDISEKLDLHKSTVYRILSTLQDWNYVEKTSDGVKYKLGLKIIEISSLYLNHIELKTEALPYLTDLMERSKQPVHLAIMDKGEVVYIDKVDKFKNIRMYSQIGLRAPVHCTALGKCILSNMSREDIIKIIKEKGLNRRTLNTITNEQDLFYELEKVNKKGYAIDDEENEAGIRCIAAPIWDYRNQIIAAVSTSGSVEMFTYENLERLKYDVVDTAFKISKRLGYRVK